MLLYIIFAVLVGHITCELGIIDAGYAIAGKFPFEVSLQINGRHHCGGSIISETFIVTAAHCVVGKQPLQMKAIVGTTDLLAGDGMSFDIAEFIVHSQYDDATLDGYDISLIRLSKAMPLGTKTLNKIEMVAPKTIVPPNTMAVITGFGSANANATSVMTNKLKYTILPFSGPRYCNPLNITGITKRMICVFDEEIECNGDCGAPLTVNDKLLGLASWGFYCEHGPAMFTNVGAFREWIKQHSGV